MILNKVIDTQIKARLAELGGEDDERQAMYLSDQSGLPYIDLRIHTPEMSSLLKIKLSDAEKYNLAPFKVSDKTLHIALLNPSDGGTLEFLKNYINDNDKPLLYVASKASLNHIYKRYADIDGSDVLLKGVVDISNENINLLTEKIEQIDSIHALVENVVANVKKEKISRLVEIIIAGAIKFKASDIHLEPEEELIRVRYRIDGNLIDIFKTDSKIYSLIASRFKILSGLKLSNQMRAQDGRFTIDFNGDNVEVRVSLVPGAYGESFVMRLLNPSDANVDIAALGMNSVILEKLDAALAKPFGMILTTGPTGSGKSTTLYSCLKKSYTPEVKILTIEDPIEYHMEGITQTQVNIKQDYTFLTGLRAALRQDPDIIMVGEIRDEDTAKVASQAALTGHIVLSTLHTNSAAGTIPRLISLGVDIKTLGSSLSLIIAQRLCRKLCTYCKIESVSDDKISKIITNVLGEMLSDQKESKYSVKSVYTVFEANEPGCMHCINGYKGRVGIYEGIVMDKDIEKVGLEGSEREIKEAARKQMIPTMREDGIIKLLDGIISFEELQEVVDLLES
jgi:type IV pilus assembly protein PilB